MLLLLKKKKFTIKMTQNKISENFIKYYYIFFFLIIECKRRPPSSCIIYLSKCSIIIFQDVQDSIRRLKTNSTKT